MRVVIADRLRLGVVLGIVLVALTTCSDDEPGPFEPDDSTSGDNQQSWEHPDGTLHHYEAVAIPGGLDWNAAYDSALARGGYLATITSADENAVIFALVDSLVYWRERPGGGLSGPWTGGLQPGGSSEPGGNWRWVSGEALNYANWAVGQPDEAYGSNQNRIHFGIADSACVATWDDLPGEELLAGFIVEYSDSTAAHTVGLLTCEDGAYEGYTLFAPLQYSDTYLIDLQGRLVHRWSSSYCPGNVAYLLDGGHLLRTASFDPTGMPPFTGGGAGGRIEEYDWGGTLVWEYEYASEEHLLHHDIEVLPNGNVLMLAWEYKSAAEAIAAGRKPHLVAQGALWPDHIIEAAPTGASGGTIVWEWHVWDHLIQDYDSTKANYGVVGEHPELIDINFDPDGNGWADWNHTNAIDYHAGFDQILLSVRCFSEIWVIDHSTTILQAGSHSGGAQKRGGDLLYRWGNPQAYRAGTEVDQQLFVQHDAQWIGEGLPGAGHILVFNNGEDRPDGSYSSVDEIAPPVDATGTYTRTAGEAFGPAEALWRYTAENPADFYSSFISGAQRLPNGNTLICEGAHGTFFEVTSAGEIVWKYVNPVAAEGPIAQGELIPETTHGCSNTVFRAYRFGSQDPALAGHDLSAGDPIEGAVR